MSGGRQLSKRLHGATAHALYLPATQILRSTKFSPIPYNRTFGKTLYETLFGQNEFQVPRRDTTRNAMLAWLREISLRLLSTLGLYNKKATVVLLGLDNSGKSTLLHRLSQGQVTALQPTERPHIDEFQLGGISFKAWDLGGHEAVRYLWFDFLGDSQAIVFMVDGADKERLDESHWELTELLSEPSLDGVPVAVLYNKSDLPSAIPEERLQGMLDLERLEARRPIKTFVTSVIKGQGYPEAFRWLATHL